jgi:hypothetical protein
MNRENPSDETLDRMFANPSTGESMNEYFATFWDVERLETSYLCDKIIGIVGKCATDANVYDSYKTNPELKNLMVCLIQHVTGVNTSFCNKDFLDLRRKFIDGKVENGRDEFFAGVCDIVDGYLEEFKKHPKENGFCENMLKSVTQLKDCEKLKDKFIVKE